MVLYYIPDIMEMSVPSVQKGRPREFCVDGALAAALRVFWTKGFDGTSVNDLTCAMGISKPSLYAAFGNKEALFHKALDLYEAEKLAYTRLALEEPTARKVAEFILRGAIEAQAGSADPKGCMGVIHSLACDPHAEAIKADVVARRMSSQKALVERFERARVENDLPAHVDPQALTTYLYAILQGMAVQAGSGATREDLEKVVELSLALWPSA